MNFLHAILYYTAFIRGICCGYAAVLPSNVSPQKKEKTQIEYERTELKSKKNPLFAKLE